MRWLTPRPIILIDEWTEIAEGFHGGAVGLGVGVRQRERVALFQARGHLGLEGDAERVDHLEQGALARTFRYDDVERGAVFLYFQQLLEARLELLDLLFSCRFGRATTTTAAPTTFFASRLLGLAELRLTNEDLVVEEPVWPLALDFVYVSLRDVRVHQAPEDERHRSGTSRLNEMNEDDDEERRDARGHNQAAESALATQWFQ